MRIPKPSKRAPKPKRRILRSASPKRAAKPRKQRKGKRASISRECDRLWSLIVRAKGRCDECYGTGGEVLQGAHGFSRRYRATRWLPINGFPLCRKHHVYFTHRPLEWDAYLRVAWGEPTYTELRHLALQNAKQDMPSVLAKLREEAERLGIK